MKVIGKANKYVDESLSALITIFLAVIIKTLY